MVDLFIQIRIVDVIDVLLVALLLYGLYRLLKGTAAISIFVGIVAIFLIWQLVNALQMELLTTILGAFVSVGFIALIIIFQPEIRRGLFTIGTKTQSGENKFFRMFRRKKQHVTLDTETICLACKSMSDIKQGALIVITRQNTLPDIVMTGVSINAEISKLLFDNKLTVALRGYDLLNQSKNINVTDASNYHQETWNNTLGRYIILSLTYRFGSFGGRRMGGGSGGFGGGMGGGRGGRF